MRLVIGGAFQGKKDYVKQTFHLEDAEMRDGATASYEDIFHCPCLYHFHEWIRKGLEENWNLDNLEGELLEKNPEIILVSNELGYGVVPIEAFDRKYRETTGRVCTRIAQKSSQVIRAVCGIGTVIKDA